MLFHIFKHLVLSFFFFSALAVGCSNGNSSSPVDPNSGPTPNTSETFQDVAYAFPFPHKPHILKETNQECLSCHAFSPKQMGTQFNCTSCHIEERKISFKTTSKKILTKLSSFPHNKHIKMNCAECHKISGQKVDYLQLSFSSCNKCHGRHEKYEQEEKCLSCHIPPLQVAGQKRQLSFSHGNHIQKEYNNCLRCHTKTLSAPNATSSFVASSDLSSMSAQCLRCHAGSRLSSKFVTREFPSFNFSHKDHLKKGESCKECHLLEKGQWKFQKGLPGYEGCLNCHNPWRLQKHKDFGNCKQCHNPSDPQKMLMEEGTKESLTFVLQRDQQKFHQDHSTGKNCSQCHFQGRVSTVALPPPAQKKKFLHKSHLPGGEENFSSCIKCHPKAESPKEISFATCAECHSGSLGQQSESKKNIRPLFQHNQHKKMSCGECHSFSTLDGGKVEKDCLQCHKPLTSIDLRINTHKPCLRCHSGYNIFQEKKRSVEKIQELVLDQLKTVHERTGSCSLCHEQEKEKSLSMVTEIVRRTGGVHNPLGCGKCHLRFQK